MPDDRELSATRASSQLLADQLPGQAALDELVVSRQSETLESNDILLKKPFGILFWLALGFFGLVVVLAIIANLLPLPNPDFQNYAALNATPGIHQGWTEAATAQSAVAAQAAKTRTPNSLGRRLISINAIRAMKAAAPIP